MEGLGAPDRERGVLGVEGLGVLGREPGLGMGPYGDVRAVALFGQDVKGSRVGVAIYQDD